MTEEEAGVGVEGCLGASGATGADGSPLVGLEACLSGQGVLSIPRVSPNFEMAGCAGYALCTPSLILVMHPSVIFAECRFCR